MPADKEVRSMFDADGYESIDDIARGEGFFIDDDGHWIPMDDADDFDCEYYGIDPDKIELL